MIYINKIIVVICNFIVAGLNLKVYKETKDIRDYWATIAWIAAGTAWLVGMLGG